MANHRLMQERVAVTKEGVELTFRDSLDLLELLVHRSLVELVEDFRRGFLKAANLQVRKETETAKTFHGDLRHFNGRSYDTIGATACAERHSGA
jgi:hypothetical protein